MQNQARMKLRISSIVMIILAFLIIFPPTGIAGTFVSGIATPTGLAIHPSERSLYVKSGSSGTVWKIPIKTDGNAGAIEVVTDQFNPALDIKFDASGNLYGITNLNDDAYLERIDSSGAVCSSMINYDKPYSGIAIESPGLSTNRLFFNIEDYGGDLHALTLSSYTCSGWSNNSKIADTCGGFRFLLYRITRADLVGSYGGTVSSINTNSGSCTPLISSLVQPNGLAEDNKGNLYVADTGAGKIIKRTSLGETVEIAQDLSGPTGLAYDAQTGLLFVSETSANRIVTLPIGVGLSGAISVGVRDPSGQWSKALHIPKGSSPVQPAAALDSAGNLYVFIRKSDDMLYMNKQTPKGSWGTWTKVPGGVKSSSAPTAVAANGKILLYVRGFDDRIWENAFSISTQRWGNWRIVKGFVTPASPEVTADEDGNVHLLIREMR